MKMGNKDVSVGPNLVYFSLLVGMKKSMKHMGIFYDV